TADCYGLARRARTVVPAGPAKHRTRLAARTRQAVAAVRASLRSRAPWAGPTVPVGFRTRRTARTRSAQRRTSPAGGIAAPSGPAGHSHRASRTSFTLLVSWIRRCELQDPVTRARRIDVSSSTVTALRPATVGIRNALANAPRTGASRRRRPKLLPTKALRK